MAIAPTSPKMNVYCNLAVVRELESKLDFDLKYHRYIHTYSDGTLRYSQLYRVGLMDVNDIAAVKHLYLSAGWTTVDITRFSPHGHEQRLLTDRPELTEIESKIFDVWESGQQSDLMRVELIYRPSAIQALRYIFQQLWKR